MRATKLRCLSGTILKYLDSHHQHCAVSFIDSHRHGSVDNLSVSCFFNYLAGRTQAVIADGVIQHSFNWKVSDRSIFWVLFHYSLYCDYSTAIPAVWCPLLCGQRHDSKVLGTLIHTFTMVRLQTGFDAFQLPLISQQLVFNSDKTGMLFTRPPETQIPQYSRQPYSMLSQTKQIETVTFCIYLGCIYLAWL